MSPDSYEPIKIALQYITRYKKVFACIGNIIGSKDMVIGETPVADLTPLIPKSYRNPGHPLYELYDKDYVTKDAFTRIMAPYMNDDDILIKINKTPNVRFFFPQSILSEKYKIAIKLQSCGVRKDKMRQYFVEDYENDSFAIISNILSARRGSTKHTAYLLKKLREDKLIDF